MWNRINLGMQVIVIKDLFGWMRGWLIAETRWEMLSVLCTDFTWLRKLLEVIISSTLVIIILHSLIIRYSYEKQFNFFVVICLLMLASLLCTYYLTSRQYFLLTLSYGSCIEFFRRVFLQRLLCFHCVLRRTEVGESLAGLAPQKNWEVDLLHCIWHQYHILHCHPDWQVRKPL